MTMRRRPWLIWGAARPIPGALYIVANMRGIRSRTRSPSSGLTGRARALSSGLGAIKIGSVSAAAVEVSLVLMVAKHLAVRLSAINDRFQGGFGRGWGPV